MLVLLALMMGLPLLNFLVLLVWRERWTWGYWWAVASMAAVFGLSLWMCMGAAEAQQWVIYRLEMGTRTWVLSLYLDQLSRWMMALVCGVSWLVHLFSVSYMRGDRHYHRYFAYLGLFTVAMLGILATDHLLVIYIFWELVGLASYLLIGFWYEKPAAAAAAKKAFVVNRVGDFGLMIGILLLYTHTGELTWTANFEALHDGSLSAGLTTFIGLCLFAGAMGKSAQFPLHIWLPDAMEGPTPVSALIHAATMVAAGVYLGARIFGLLSPDALLVITVLGLMTAFVGGFSALAQTDIKKVLAYSTLSQLGYMMMALGMGVPQLALFHLFTHAFFKACLFLSAGSVIHALHHWAHEHHLPLDAQHMYLMGGLRKAMPFTFVCYTVAAAALVGLPLTTGFLSKDALLAHSLGWAQLQGGGTWYLFPVTAFLTAFLTAFYMGRQWVLVFWGDDLRAAQLLQKPYSPQSLPEADGWMRIPLAVLALGSVWICFSINPLDGAHSWFLEGLPQWQSLGAAADLGLRYAQAAHDVHLLVATVSVLLALAGLSLSFLIFSKSQAYAPNPLQDEGSLWHQLSLKGLYMGQWYDKAWSRAFQRSSEKALGIDQTLSQGLGSGVVWSSKQVATLDNRWVDGLVNLVAKIPVVLAHLIAWFDKNMVDGLVNFVAWLAAFVGLKVRTPARGGVSQYVFAAVLLLMLLLWYWVG
ncbi:NADH-quinone oxidoreductase subunit L [Eisenibacter elegans]|uniref:NADH-quinone oxidoreductase subunit 5 family protein n=1 Tax=Eisenibacter elegans TaxID=997 RepID=UPI00042070A5|nr:NADH-quinone oxidoreductase subunit L [Eisenibacter elegans]